MTWMVAGIPQTKALKWDKSCRFQEQWFPALIIVTYNCSNHDCLLNF